jgi:hypothetical protein
LDLAFAELLLGVQSRARFVARAGLHLPWMQPRGNGLQSIQDSQRVFELIEE